ncbi:MAG: zinc ribbon domain-containing protein [Gammaproteobacteria bacterium]|nr:zinc ribbon domain-containing protein [Gammaproteobacteria bacterium]
MPLYEYHCTNCNESTELLQKMSDEPAKTCPHCHKDDLVKQISSSSFQLKGNGWYVTDFKNKPTTPVVEKPKVPDKAK